MQQNQKPSASSSPSNLHSSQLNKNSSNSLLQASQHLQSLLMLQQQQGINSGVIKNHDHMQAAVVACAAATQSFPQFFLNQYTSGLNQQHQQQRHSLGNLLLDPITSTPKKGQNTSNSPCLTSLSNPKYLNSNSSSILSKCESNSNSTQTQSTPSSCLSQTSAAV